MKGIHYTSVPIDSAYREFICLEIFGKDGSFLFTSVYRSPDNGKDDNAKLLQLIQDMSDIQIKYKVFVGDFNIPRVDWNRHLSLAGANDINTLFLEKVRDCFLVQHVREITRMRGANKGSTLDLILSNDETIIENLSVDSPLGKSDHASIGFDCNVKELQKTEKKVVYMYEKADYNLKRQKLSIDWKKYLSEPDIEGKWTKFKEKMLDTIEECVPKRKITDYNTKWRMNRNLPMSRKLWSKIKRKQRLWGQMKRLKDNNYRDCDNRWERRTYNEIETEYRRVNNQVRRETRKVVKRKEQEIARLAKENPKVFWKYVQSKTRTKAKIPELYADQNKSNMTTNDRERAEVLAGQFSEVFVREPEGESPKGTETEVPLLQELKITKEKIRRVLRKMKKDKSPGPDQLHLRILKEGMEELIEPLKILFECSFESQQLPTDWKIADITAIFKKGNKSEAGNYRPVSLTCTICKCMENLIREEIMAHMKQNQLLSKKQYGFIPGRSTVLQLIKVLDNWTKVVDEGKTVDVIYCDFLKVFDRVPHKRLMEKISCCGIRGKCLGWIKEFLTNRRQRVVVNGVASDWRDVISGVPQGSVLGPLLFVIFINDLPNCTENVSDIYLYADDTKIFKTVEEEDDRLKLQEDLNNMKKWTEKWLLSFHPGKSRYMRIGRADLGDSDYQLYNPIERSTEEKDIGVIIDDKLKFSEHLAEKINKANKIVGIIRRTFVGLNAEMFRQLYVALVRPHLEYANQVWNPYLIKDIEAVENVQRRATRLLPNMKNLSYEERLRALNLPTLSHRRSRGDLIETYKILSGKYDKDCSEDVFQERENSTTRGNSKKIFKPQSRLNMRKYSFPCRVVDMWNALPEWVINCETVKGFEKQIDKHWSNQEQKYDYKALISTTRSQNVNRQVSDDGDEGVELELQAE